MRAPLAILTALFVGSVAAPLVVLGQGATSAEEHQQHHPAATAPNAPTAPAAQRAGMQQMPAGMNHTSGMMARMHANDAKLDQLVTKMRSAQGAAKTEAIAELLTALVEDRKNNCEPMMAQMMSMMNAPANAGTSPGPPAPAPRAK